jgi:uncharacterized protein YeaO (DUF488 family)
LEQVSPQLEKNNASVYLIVDKAKEESITLLYGTKEEKFNNAMALKEYLEEKIKK